MLMTLNDIFYHDQRIDRVDDV